ncbi:condensation protein [Actinocrinis puniceicyclus]|uniref:Condensation protein n=1 Tax=Actinocrinis puniceicyclus TaxID=977794 RepID=A0A8J8BES1_9ACTN|nr:condensation domain-containing protein [Actinocrinis puniceicyclus]MBS2965451.1 condensation protein [Actinocrinis puniceicyclus]
MAVTLSEIAVEFRGEGAGAGEPTWGQLGIWRTIRRTGRTMNIVVTMPLPEGTPLAEMQAVLRFLVSRHPALRTLLRFEDGAPGGPPVQQVVAASGRIPLQIADIDDGDDPAAAAEELRSRYELTPFDYRCEFPVRMGVVRQSGALAHLVVGYSHVMVDGAGIVALSRDLAHLDRDTGRATAPPAALGPLELAAAQRGATGRRQSDRSLRYWAAQLDRLPAWHPAEPATPRQPRFWELVMCSPALALGLRAAEARTGIGSTYVLLAAYSVAVAQVFGRNPSVAQIVVGNRFRPGFADLAAQVSQHGICVVDTADATFDEVVARAQSAATSASFYGYYDPDRCAALLAESAARLGGPPEISWHLNDRRGVAAPQDGGAEDGGAAPTARQLTAALPLTEVRWGRKEPAFDGDLFLQVDSEHPLADRRALARGLPAVYLEVWTDTHQFALAQIEAFARAMESVVVESARGARITAPRG